MEGKQKSKFLLLASVLLFLLIVLLVIIISRRNNQEGPLVQNQTDKTGGQMMDKVNVAQNAIQPPQALFGSWTGLQATQTYPSSSSVYTFKTDYTFDEAQTILNKLGFTSDITTENNTVVGYDAEEEGNGLSVAAVNLTNGTMAYNSTDGIKLPAGATLGSKSVAFLRSLGMYDTTMEVGAQYKSKKHPGKTFVEIHRSWEKVGLPIFNAVGLLNLPEDQELSALTLDSTNQTNGTDADIYATTDKSDGKTRSDEFNTITLGISDEDQSVTLIKSNMRPLATAAPSTSTLITYDEAVAMLRAGNYEFIYTTPAGGGDGTPWDKIFPQNKAEAQVANVSEALVVYLENHPSATQAALTPYFIFRGTAELSSGYTSRFVAGIPAISSTQSFSLVPAVHAQADDTGQKQGTFEMDPATRQQVDNPLTPTAVPPIQNGVPIPGAAGDQAVCDPTVAQMNPVVAYGGLYFGLAPRPDKDHKPLEWYYIPTEGNVAVDSVLVANLQQIVDALQAAINNPGGNITQPPVTAAAQNLTPTVYQTNEGDTGQKQSTFEVPTVAQPTYTAQVANKKDLKIRLFRKIIGDIQDQVDYCPLRLTGSSPTVFIYGEEGTRVQVQPGADLSYASPYIPETGSWDVVTHADGSLTVNGLERGYMYYEYTGAGFAQPPQGWVISKSGISTFVSDVVAPGLGLTEQEAARAVFELTHAASSVTADTLFVGLVPQKDIDAALPLSVTGVSNVSRYHFYVAAAGTASVSSPQLEPIVRGSSLVLEIGSYAKQ